MTPSSDFQRMFAKPPDEPIDLDAYWSAPSSEGEMGAAWVNKPHRLLYDCLKEIYHLRLKLADGRS